MSRQDLQFGRGRFAPLGGARTSALAVGWVVAVLALVGAAGWAAYARFAPVPEVGAFIAPPPVPPTPSVQGREVRPLDERRSQVASLTQTNIFVSSQATAPVAPDSGEDDQIAGDVEPEPVPVKPIEIVGDDDDELPPIPITARDDAPDDVKAAFNNLLLVGLHRGRDGTPYASVKTVTDAAASPPPLPRGAEFTDPAHADVAWEVARVDMSAQRIIVSRSDVNLALPLFPLRARVVTSGAASSVPGPGEVVIAYRTLDEAILEMKEAGISDAVLMEVLAEMKRLEDEANGVVPPSSQEVAAEKIKEIFPTPSSGDGEGGEAQTQRDIMREIAEMMISGTAPIDEPDAPEPDEPDQESPEGED
jgi:hypothetical protein